MQNYFYKNISPIDLKFSTNFFCSYSTVGQVMSSIYNINQQLINIENKTIVQEKIIELTDMLFNNYMNNFINIFDKDTIDRRKEVYCINLNGFLNNGQLSRCITVNNVINEKLKYKDAQFIDILELLKFRLLFIIKKDFTKSQKYNDDIDFRNNIDEIKSKINDFYEYLEGIIKNWVEFINDQYVPDIPNPIKLSDEYFI